MYLSMDEKKVPRGVKFSFFVMSAPLLLASGYLSIMIPLIEAAKFGSAVSPENFAYVARTVMRLLNLNIAFLGGVNYGLGSAVYETSLNSEDTRRAKN